MNQRWPSLGTVKALEVHFLSERMALALILIAAAVLRVFKLTAFALWFDESVSVTIAQYPWTSLMAHVEQDIGPPLYFIALKAWTIPFGSSVLAVRSLSLVFELLAIYACYAFVITAFHRVSFALLASLFLAVNPFQIQYSRETRMYGMGVCAVLVASWLMARAITSNRVRDWLLYGISAAACVYTHYYLVFSVAAQAVVALVWCVSSRERGRSLVMRGRLWRICLAYGGAAALFAPWVPALLVQSQRVQQDFWIPRLTWEQILRIPWTLMLGGSDSGWTPVSWLAVFAGVLLMVGTAAMSAAASWQSWLVILQALLPIALGLALSIERPAFVDRYFLFASAFWVIMLAQVVLMIRRDRLRIMLTGTIIIVSLFGLMKNLNAIGIFSIRHPQDRPGMAGAAAFLNANALRDDSIVVSHSFIYFPFRYYNRTPIQPGLYAPANLAGIPVYAGRGLLTEGELIHDLAGISPPRTIWFLWTDGFYQHKPPIPLGWHLRDSRQFDDTVGFKGSIYVEEYWVE